MTDSIEEKLNTVYELVWLRYGSKGITVNGASLNLFVGATFGKDKRTIGKYIELMVDRRWLVPIKLYTKSGIKSYCNRNNVYKVNDPDKDDFKTIQDYEGVKRAIQITRGESVSTDVANNVGIDVGIDVGNRVCVQDEKDSLEEKATLALLNDSI